MGMKKLVCFTVDENVLRELEEIWQKTGVSISAQIELRLKRYEIKKA
jgi:antitoxin component of RelBE/YafQ-DinJ toxin-antitoxin module